MRNLLMALVVFGSSLLGLAFAQEGFVQLRFFYPYSGTDFSSGFALDAALKYPFDSNNLTLAIKNTTTLRQTVGLELQGDWGLVSADFTSEAGAAVGARRIGLTVVGVLILPRSADITPLETVTAVFVHDTDDSAGSSFYVVDVASLALNGQVAQDWRWSAGYSLASTVTSSSKVVHTFNAGIRGKLLAAVTLGVGGALTLANGASVYGGSLDLAWQLTSTENLAARVTVNSKPVDTQSLTFTTTAIQPVTLGVSLGRSSVGGLTAGASLDASLDGGWSVSAAYAGAFGTTQSHEANAGLAYSSRQASGSFGVNFGTTLEAGVWNSRYGANANASYKAGEFQFSLRGNYNFDATPNVAQPNSGNASATLNWRSAPLEVIFDTSFQFRGVTSGTAQLQVLYDLTPALAINGSVLFTRVLTSGGQNSFSFGAGLRYRF